ncbi:MAG: HD domain-containing protein [Bacilli bacterium]
MIQSEPIQRLKGIHQAGASYLVNPSWCVTRYDHCIGVMLLILKMGGTLEEQIAGLLHDVSHTAFSHVIDYVFDNRDEDFHDLTYNQMISQSEIPHILKKYGYDIKTHFIGVSNWNLLEQSAPELCADRIDYTLRDLYEYGEITIEEVQLFLKHLINLDGKIFLTHLEAAEWFVRIYYKEVIDFFMHPMNVYGNEIIAKILKYSLAKNIIQIETLQTTDEEVMAILRNAENKEISEWLLCLHPNVVVEIDQVNFHIHRKLKARIIDPTMIIGSEQIVASTLSPVIKALNEEARRKFEAGVFLKIVST